MLQYSATVSKHDSVEHEYKESASFAESIGGLKEQAKSDFTEESCLCSQVPLISHKEGTGLTEHAAEDFCCADPLDSDADVSLNLTREVGEVAARCALGSQTRETREPPGKKDLVLKNACTVIPGQKHSEGTENHSITGDSGIDSSR